MNKIQRFNDKVAICGSTLFGNMWSFWLFMVWGLLGIMPFVPVSFRETILLVSSGWLQLAALPLLAVGGVVLNRTSEARAKSDHRMIMAELTEVKAMHQELHEALDATRKGLPRRRQSTQKAIIQLQRNALEGVLNLRQAQDVGGYWKTAEEWAYVERALAFGKMHEDKGESDES